MNKNEKWLKHLMAIQGLAQAGLTYSEGPYDLDRYAQLRDIVAEMLAERSDLTTAQAKHMYYSESGYQTPKVDTRAAIFDENGRILLVHERNDTWSLPGGWCDNDRSVSENTVKECLEETGLRVCCERLIAVHDWTRHNDVNYPFGIVKTFMLCSVVEGTFQENIETTEIRYFSQGEIPKKLATEKVSRDQIEMCFRAHRDPDWKTAFD